LQLFQSASVLGIDEAQFLKQIRATQTDMQAYMAVEQVVNYLNKKEKTLLERLAVYHSPVIELGVCLLAEDLADCSQLLQRLVAFSLVDVEKANDLTEKYQFEYQLSPLVTEWLQKQGIEPPPLKLRKTAAHHQELHCKVVCLVG